MKKLLNTLIFTQLLFVIIAMLFAGMLLFGTTSCKKFLPKEVNFDMNGADIRVTVLPQSQTGNLKLTEKDVNINIDSAIDANTKDIYSLKSAKLLSAQVDVMTQGQNLDAVENIYFYADHSDVGKRRVAYKDNIPKGSTYLSLDLDDVNLADYLRKHPFKFMVEGKVVQPTTTPIDLKIRLRYRIVASRK